MIKLQVIEEFTLKDFAALKNITRKSADQKGKLFVGDTFECDEKMAKYLLGDNPLHRPVVNIAEIKPEKKVKEESKADITEAEFEIRSDEVKEIVNEKAKEVEEIIKAKSTKKKKTSKK